MSSDFGEAFVKPPELNKGENYDDRVDVWYLGICFLIMLSNHKEIMNFNSIIIGFDIHGDREQMTQWYLNVNPSAVVPTLIYR